MTLPDNLPEWVNQPLFALNGTEMDLGCGIGLVEAELRREVICPLLLVVGVWGGLGG